MYCAGYYKPVRADDYDLSEMLKHQQINYLGALYVLDAVLPHFLQRQAGHISLVSSVAGYRGLPKSLAYGPTKAALINLAEALYIDLQASRIGVSVINPGFVKTPATAQNDFTMPGLLTTAEAATEILAGWRQGAFEILFPKRFTRWMKTLQILPYAAYFAITKRLVKSQAEAPKASPNRPYN
jgi:short-subunit dehydrogenase